MARLTDEQWALFDAEYRATTEGSKPIIRYAEKYGCTESAIRQRIKNKGLIGGETSDYIEKKIKLVKDLQEFKRETSDKTSEELRVVDDIVEFRIRNDYDLQAIQSRLMDMLPAIDSPQGILAAMTATTKHREAKLGKQPDTAIQINNNVGGGNEPMTLEQFYGSPP